MQQTGESGGSQQAPIAKPYYQIKSPFPLELDRRFIDQNKGKSMALQRRRQKTPSESVRCYWAVLSTRPADVGNMLNKANLVFLHLDPTMEESLGYSVESLMGTSALDLVHPNDAKWIETNILQYVMGSRSEKKVLQCTMKSVLSMGKYVHSSLNDRKLDFSTFTQSKEEDHQLTDIRMELIGDEMLLCFFHAVEDRSKQDYNQQDKSQWTNWCETPLDAFDDQHCQTLWEHILAVRFIAPSSSAIERHQSGFPKTVFQILTDDPQKSILFSWPPPRLFESMQHFTSISGTEIYRDGSYFADAFARLTNQLDFQDDDFEDYQRLTACKSQLQAAASIYMDGFALDLFVKIILHGEIKFALFFVEKAEYFAEHQPNRLEKDDVRYKQMYPLVVHEGQGSPFFTWASSSRQQQQPEDWTSDFRPIQSFSQTSSASSSSNRNSERVADFNSSQNDDVQASSSARTNEAATFSPMTDAILAVIHGTGQDSEERSQMISPTMKCSMCGTTKSPEWRRGPAGKKSLCNACGLRYSRETTKTRKQG
ncbi:uncharacterized protein FA14DRAFT_140012 [Meira miltonrushii]|uniref:GATA-type domain-containing protein n=1 Tax=Meira miltonrushii TaxID=1280837 RepID=A0A316V2X2_9BASI|nr:uncharacterized protein FA14DRAFT_140012 [Meira miltonrushii]PWN31348.1 hypothetical protein FA14DRAFT_140012 [Meira miltonrushii]